MPQTTPWIKRFVFVCGLLFLALCAVIAVVALWHHRREIAFQHQHIQPRVDFVEQFRAAHGRLPSSAEFAAFDETQRNLSFAIYATMTDSADFIRSYGGGASSDYAIRVWRGEHFVSYFSWKASYFDEPYSNEPSPNPAMQRTGSVRHGLCLRTSRAALRRSLILFSLGD
jgi:hypothetical protein